MERKEELAVEVEEEPPKHPCLDVPPKTKRDLICSTRRWTLDILLERPQRTGGGKRTLLALQEMLSL